MSINERLKKLRKVLGMTYVQFAGLIRYSPSRYRKDYSVAIAAIGDNALRVKWTMELIQEGFVIPTLIHPSANIMANSYIGPGSIVCAGATVGLGVKIGRGLHYFKRCNHREKCFRRGLDAC